MQENQLLPLHRDYCSLSSPGAIMGCHFQCSECPLLSLPSCSSHSPLPQQNGDLVPLQQSRDSQSWELWDDGQTPPDLLLIPVAATEIHHKTRPHHQPFKELKKILSKSPLLKTDTPNLALWLFPGAFQAAKPQRAGSRGRHPSIARPLPSWIIPAWNFTGQMWEWDQSPPDKPSSLLWASSHGVLGPCLTSQGCIPHARALSPIPGLYSPSQGPVPYSRIGITLALRMGRC